MELELAFDASPDAGTATETIAPREARVGPFEVVETVAETGSRAVHRARRAGARRPASLVRLVVARRGIEEETLGALRALEAPGVSRVLSWGRLSDGRLWCESELPRGPTLEQMVHQIGALPVERCLAFAAQIVESLARVHASGLVHGGLDARRVVLPNGERPVLLDAAIAWRGSDPSDDAAVRATPPEVWRGRRPDFGSDLYSAGVLLFFALAGRYPFEDADPLDVCRRHLHLLAPTLAAAGVAATTELEEIVARLLAKQRIARFPSAEIARAAIERALLRHRARPARPADAPGDVPPPSGYRFLRRLGEGGAGSVFEAFHETLERIAAVKVIRPGPEPAEEARERFLREARLASSLEHPGAVRVLDAREEGGRLYLIMELVDGESLKDRLTRVGALDERAALALARDVLDTLRAAHERGIVHRDVKPDNILVAKNGAVKLADFGLARSLAASADITQQGYVLGTPYYMSPEQCRGEQVDERSDLYSLGVTLYHMLAGRPPFQGETILSVIDQQVRTPPLPLALVNPGVSDRAAALVACLLEKDPERRPARARDVIASIDALLERPSTT